MAWSWLCEWKIRMNFSHVNSGMHACSHLFDILMCVLSFFVFCINPKQEQNLRVSVDCSTNRDSDAYLGVNFPLFLISYQCDCICFTFLLSSRPKSTLIYHSTSGTLNPCNWYEMGECLSYISEHLPLLARENTVWEEVIIKQNQA